MPLVPSRGGAREKDYPLLSARVHYDLVDVYLSAQLSQTYKSEASHPSEVRYVFQLPSDASVYAFEATIDRTRTIKGVSKEKRQAKADYERAKRQGRAAALLEQDTAEVFEISLGNVQPNSVIDVQISFFSIVEHDGSVDTLRLRFPTTIAPHYGRAPTRIPLGFTPAVLELTLDVVANAPIRSVRSVSHPIETTIGRVGERETDSFDPGRARIRLSSQKFLETDIVVVVRCQDLDRPRCTVESLGPSEGAEEYTEAYALTLVPRFESALIPMQEYIFLVDRSGSMSGNKMSAVRSALRILLASLPSSDTTFNIISFGDRNNPLWERSVPYDTDTFTHAIKHVDRMEANYGGTEISGAILSAGRKRKITPGVPSSIFLLTDGEAWDQDGVATVVRDIVNAGKEADSPVKFFCMGIGNSPSKDLVDTIARVGQGVAVFARDDEEVSLKLVSLLRAARNAPVDNLTIDWGAGSDSLAMGTSDNGFEMIASEELREVQHTLSTAEPMPLFSESIDFGRPTSIANLGPKAPSPINLPPPPQIQQAPPLSSFPLLYPGFRFSVFAIIRRGDTRSFDQSRFVRISGTAQGRPVTLDIPVLAPETENDRGEANKFIHVVAARALIRDFEDHKPMSAVDKAEVLRLAVRYGISSSQTAFVAVENEEYTRDSARKEENGPSTSGHKEDVANYNHTGRTSPIADPYDKGLIILEGAYQRTGTGQDEPGHHSSLHLPHDTADMSTPSSISASSVSSAVSVSARYLPGSGSPTRIVIERSYIHQYRRRSPSAETGSPRSRQFRRRARSRSHSRSLASGSRSRPWSRSYTTSQPAVEQAPPLIHRLARSRRSLSGPSRSHSPRRTIIAHSRSPSPTRITRESRSRSRRSRSPTSVIEQHRGRQSVSPAASLSPSASASNYSGCMPTMPPPIIVPLQATVERGRSPTAGQYPISIMPGSMPRSQSPYSHRSPSQPNRRSLSRSRSPIRVDRRFSRTSYGPSIITMTASVSARSLSSAGSLENVDDGSHISTARLACLQHPDGAFMPKDELFALVGGHQIQGLFDTLVAQFLTSTPARHTSESSAIILLPPNSAKEKKKKSMKGKLHRMINGLRQSVNTSSPKSLVSATGLPTASSNATSLSDASLTETLAKTHAERIWATFLMLAVLEIKLSEERDVWVFMEEKARAWISIELGKLQFALLHTDNTQVSKFAQELETEAKRVVENT